MEPKAKSSNLATIVATAAVTIAVGLTVASLGGYLRPEAPPAPTVTEPIMQEPAASPPAEPMVASYHEHERGRHHERKHEHEDD